MHTAPRSGVRLVLDTNIVVSGLIWSGPPARLVRLARSGLVDALTSNDLLDELFDVITREKFVTMLKRRQQDAAALFEDYAELCELVGAAPIPPTVLRDRDDDAVLAAASAGNAAMIVTGDLDLLDIGPFRTIPILTAAQAVAVIEEQGTT